MKNRKKTFKIGIIFIILIFSLASISISYAGWTDTVEVNGNLITWEEPASRSDYVWLDQNQNGLQDPLEPGVIDIIINLYMADGTFICSTVTNESGFYIFDNLSPGNYYLEFILPDMYSFTSSNIGSDDFIDSDVDPNSGITYITNLTPNENDISWDAGLITNYEGCSHGFWMNHHSDWQVYLPDELVGDVFTIPASLIELSDDTLDDALRYNGGGGIVGGARILLRNSVASLLNAVHLDVNYPMSETEVLSEVNAALASEDRDVMIDLEAILDNYNNLHGCICD